MYELIFYNHGYKTFDVCPPNRDVTLVGVGRRVGAEPRRSAALARRPTHQPTKPLPLFDRARFGQPRPVGKLSKTAGECHFYLAEK